MKYTPGIIPQNARISQWFSQYITPYLVAELQKVADALGMGQRVVGLDPMDAVGLSGHADADETQQYQALWDRIPDHTWAVLPGLDFKTRVTQSINIQGKTGSALFVPGVRPFDSRKNVSPGNQLIWDGARGDPIFAVKNCGHIGFGGFAVHAGNAGVTFDIDQTNPAPRIMTDSTLERMYLTTDDDTNRDWIAIRLSNKSGGNVEYMSFNDVQIRGARYGWSPVVGLDATITMDEPTIVRFAAPPLMDRWVGEPFFVAGAGPNLTIGRTLGARIVEAPAIIDGQADSKAIRIDQPAQQAVTNARWQARDWPGCAIEVHSPNSKRHEGHKLDIRGIGTAIRMLGGSMHLDYPNFSNNGIDWYLGDQESETSSEYVPNSEGAGMHLLYDRAGWSNTFSMYEPRLAVQGTTPGCGYLTCKSSTLIRLVGGSFDGDVPAGSTVLDLTQQAGVTMVFDGTRIPNEWENEQMGLFGFQPFTSVLFEGCPETGGQIVTGPRVEFGDSSRARVRSYGGRMHLPAPTSEQRKTDLLRPGQVTFEQAPNGQLVAVMRADDGTLYSGAISLSKVTL